MGSVFTCKLNPCCGDRHNCEPPRQYYEDEPDTVPAPQATLSHPEPVAQEAVVATHRHKARGSEYVLIGFGKMQARRWFEGFWDEECQVHAGSNVDMNDVAIYRSVDDGSLWVRPREEFEDGRFEVLTATSRQAGSRDTERLHQIAKAIDDLGWHNSAYQISNAAHTINSLRTRVWKP